MSALPSEARAHALQASELLDGISALSHRLENLTPDERLQMIVHDGFKKTNADLRWSAELAIAHALAALALVETETEISVQLEAES